MPYGYHGCYLRIDVISRPRRSACQLPDDVLRQYLGGSGLGARLLLDEGARHRADPLAPEAPLVFAFSPLVGSPLTTSAKFAVVSQSPLTGRFNDSLASSGFAVAGKRCRLRRHRHRRTRAEAVGAGRSTTATCGSSRPMTCAGESCRGDGGTAARAAWRRLPHRLDRTGRRARGPLRDDLARRPSRRPRRQRGRARQQEHQGDRRSRHAACRVGAAARADRVEPRSVEAIVRSGDGEVPRARHRNQSADVQSLRHAADAQLPAGHLRRGAEPVARAAAHRVFAHARELRGVHHRLRAHLLARWQRCPNRVREPVRARLAVRRQRSRGGAAGVAALRRAGHRHDQHRRDDCVRDGVRRAWAAR